MWPVATVVDSTALQFSRKFGNSKGTPVGLKVEATKKAELPTLNYSSPIRRRHEEQRETEQQRERGRQKPTQPHENPLTQPSSQPQMGHITLFPEKIYLSIFLEPRKNNNILQETKIKKAIKYKLRRYYGKCKRAENVSASAHSCPGRGPTPKNEPIRKNLPRLR